MQLKMGMTYERYFRLISLTKKFGWFEFIFWEAGVAGGGLGADNGIGLGLVEDGEREREMESRI